MKNPARARRMAWWISLGMTAALFAFMLCCLEVRYALNDDATTLRMFMGYETGRPASFHIYVHGLLAWPLHALGTLAPTVPWFTWMQLSFLFVSLTVIGKSIMQCFVKHEKPLWLGAVFSALFMAVLGLKYAARITFTQTAGMLGAAAVAQMLSIDHENGSTFRGMLGALALVVLGYALRQMTALAVIAFCGLAWLYIAWNDFGFGKKRSMKPMLCALLAVALVMGGMMGARELEIELNGMRDHLAWQKARINLVDYHTAARLPQEAIDAAGWSDAAHNMVSNWCFLDSSITTESFENALRVVEEMENLTFTDKAWEMLYTLAEAVYLNPVDMACLMLALGLWLFSLFFCLFTRRWKAACLLALGFALMLCMLCYLAWKGRLPIRGILMAALPFAAMVFCLLPASLPRGKAGLICALVIAVACAGYSADCMAQVLPPLFLDEESDAALGDAFGDMEEYALGEPESLFIYDLSMTGADLRAFPDYSEGMPHNVTFWGGWGMHSRENTELFASFGIDLDNFDPETFLRDDVYVASGRIDPPPTVILDWLNEQLDAEVDYEIWSEYGSVTIFHFYSME
ncbi:MAG: hypothetical protein PUD16_00645 [bacterium]|nr:hypothetical protein [bacterium]